MTGSLRRSLLIPLLLLGNWGTTACPKPVTIVTPQGAIAYTADQIVLRVNELQNAAIQANAAGALSLATTKALVEFCVSADQTLAATPSGWLATVQAAWAATKTKIGGTNNAAIVAAMSAVDAVLGALGGQ